MLFPGTSRPESQNGKILLTFDIEEYFQVENLRPAFPCEKWKDIPSRVDIGVDRILDLMERKGIHATFFVLGCVAERSPDCVREIAARGHEIACHGYAHRMLTHLSEDEIRSDIGRAKQILERVTGREIKGYRAPSFTVKFSLFRILKELGFQYDSSYFPFRGHDRYGDVRNVHLESVSDNLFRERDTGIYEVPISMLPLRSMRIPWGGGAYFRLIPSKLYRWGVLKVLSRSRCFLFYLHSWEFDHTQPKIRDGIRMTHLFRHYTGLETVERKFLELLDIKVDFITIGNYLGRLSNEDISVMA